MENTNDKTQSDEASDVQFPWYGGLEFRTLAESIPALVFVGDANGANIYTNIQFQRYTGRKKEDILDDGWLATIHPDDQKRAAATWLESWTKGKKYDAKYRFCRFDGEYRWHLVRGAPVKDGSGNIVRWIGSCTDIEDLIARINVQTQAEEILKALGTASDVIVHAKNAKGEFIYTNAALVEIVKQERQFFDGKTVGDIVGSDLERNTIEEHDKLVQLSGKAQTVVEKLTPTGLNTRHLLSTKVPLPLPDGSTGIATLSVDISNSVELEKKHKDLLVHSRNRIDTIPTITWVTDGAGKLVEVNQSWHDHSGLGKVFGLSFDDIIASGSNEQFFDQWQFCIETGEVLDIGVELKDDLAGTQVTRRALAIPMDRIDAGVNKRFWYGTFS